MLTMRLRIGEKRRHTLELNVNGYEIHISIPCGTGKKHSK